VAWPLDLNLTEALRSLSRSGRRSMGSRSLSILSRAGGFGMTYCLLTSASEWHKELFARWRFAAFSNTQTCVGSAWI